MKTIQIEIPDGKRAEWVDGVLTLVDNKPKDITERIKTFEDACEWCTLNGHHDIVKEYDFIVTDSLIISEPTKDLIAYLKLRIITCALNEGWEPTSRPDERRWFVDFDINTKRAYFTDEINHIKMPFMLALRYEMLAEYAAKQFHDIYMDFCYKGKE